MPSNWAWEGNRREEIMRVYKSMSNNPTHQQPKLRSPRTLIFSKGCRLVQELGSRASSNDAVDHLKDQNAGLGNQMIELTYGPPRRQDIERFEPKWVKMDAKVLCFDGVVREDEGRTMRYVRVQYFMEDDTLRVTEPPTLNSGLWQGSLLRRGRYPHPSGTRDYSWRDLNNGEDVQVQGRRVHLIDCDSWTKQFLTDAGIEVNPPEPKPPDPHAEAQKNVARRSEYRNRRREENGNNFFLNGGKVLRFYGIWKNYDRQPRAIRRITLKYYLSDGSLEVVENPPPNGGWCPLLPFRASSMDLATAGSSFCTLIKRQRVLLDRRTDTDRLPCYLDPRDEDGVSWIEPVHLRTGEDVRILGKTFFLAKCDDHTARHYKERWGVEMPQVEVMPKPTPLPLKVFPPHGIGRVEETLRDCFRPTDQPPKRIHRPITPKPQEVANAVLRFAAFMDTPRLSEQGRRFVVSFYPEDDTVRIVEEPHSGFGGGVFLKRGRLPFGGGSCPGRHYEIGDFRIGARIVTNGCEFVLKDADAFVLGFMERHPEIYPGLSVEKQKDLSSVMKGQTNLSDAEKSQLGHQLRTCVLHNYGCSAYPEGAIPNLGFGSSPEDLVLEKLYSANLPIDQHLLRKLVSSFTFNGRTDVDQVSRYLLETLRHQ